MATIKSYSDLEQSRKLAEILPIESADMFLAMNGTIPVMSKYIDDGLVTADETAIPCWSLAALLGILTKQDFIIKTIGNEFNIDIPIRHCKIWFSSLLDAAFEMIVWLKENGKI